MHGTDRQTDRQTHTHTHTHTHIHTNTDFSITTMTTTGYGDLVPHTVVGKLFACATMILGLVILALPITVISENFTQVSSSMRQRTLITHDKAHGHDHVPIRLMAMIICL
jgi:voltage-gated potassium channel